jgi:hypothetical protein
MEDHKPQQVTIIERDLHILHAAEQNKKRSERLYHESDLAKQDAGNTKQ